LLQAAIAMLLWAKQQANRHVVISTCHNMCQFLVFVLCLTNVWTYHGDRFSPLWQPAGQALGEALTQNPETSWPIIFQQLQDAQQQFLSGEANRNGSSSSSGGGGGGGDSSRQEGAAATAMMENHLAAAVDDVNDMQTPSGTINLEQQWGCHRLDAYSIAAAAAGSCTDASNRMSNMLKGLAGKATSGVLGKTAEDWVPLLLTFAGAVTHNELTAAAAAAAVDEGDLEQNQNSQDEAAAGANSDHQMAAAAAAAVGSKRKQPELQPAAAAANGAQQQQQQQQQHGQPQRQHTGLAGAVSREGLGALGFSVKAWRGVMMEWLGLLGAVKNTKKLTRCVFVTVNDTITQSNHHSICLPNNISLMSLAGAPCGVNAFKFLAVLFTLSDHPHPELTAAQVSFSWPSVMHS
jgi:hypothetical protein